MSDKIKETKDYLEDAQKGVLKALNSETSFLSRLFSGSAKENLKNAQSAISKAMNQVKAFKEDESGVTAKLQKHISERDDKIKALEAQIKEKEQENSNLKDQNRQLEAKIEALKTESQEEQASTVEEKTVEKANNPEDSLKEAIAKLEDKNLFLSDKLSQNKQELSDSRDLILEFSNRLNRLKSEVTSK
jgi:chromosome segregation ATPase